MGSKIAGLTRKGTGTETFNTKVDGGLMEELKALEARVLAEAPDFDVNRREIVETALRDFLKEATKELDRLKAEKANKSS